MLKTNRKTYLMLFQVLMMLVILCSCKKKGQLPDDNQRPGNLKEYYQCNEGLKDYFTPEEYFLIGSAIPYSFIYNQAKATLINRHFNSLTAENEMKWSNLQPAEGNFTFENADRIVDFAKANGLKIRGHCLCWRNQVPDWVFKDGQNKAPKGMVLERLRAHISAVMTHFKGKIYAWDVVNEAIDDGALIYRESQWYSICGEEYITEAFKAAREADPDAKLFYNDYSAVDPSKRDKIYDLLTWLKSQNLIDGVGLQGHWNISYPSDALITDAINKYSLLGIEIQITEMDVSVYTSNSDPQSVYTDDLAKKQSIAYDRYFKIFRTYKDVITGVTFWGLADDYTWLDNFPVKGRKNYPLLFDGNLNPKPAYFTVIDF